MALSANGQNLYDLEHTKKYADFLFQSRQYKLAAMEFERLLFMEPENAFARNQLIKSYRLSSQFELGILNLGKWYPEQITDNELLLEYYKLNMLDGRFGEAFRSVENQRSLPAGQRDYYMLSSILMQKQWAEAAEHIRNAKPNNTPGFAELSQLAAKQDQIKYKNPGLALAMSAVVPGSGKVYSGDWKDGIISLLFVATNAFQAYRGFSKNGIDSVYGWIFGSMALGFYAGNLFGSWKSAKNHNLRHEDAIYQEIQEDIFNRF